MRGSREDLPAAAQGHGFISRQAEWGEMNVAIENVPGGLDAEPFFKGLVVERNMVAMKKVSKNLVSNGLGTETVRSPTPASAFRFRCTLPPREPSVRPGSRTPKASL